MKTTIYLPDELGRKLAQEAEERGLSLSQCSDPLTDCTGYSAGRRGK